MWHALRAVFAIIVAVVVDMTDWQFLRPYLHILWFAILCYATGEILSIGSIRKLIAFKLTRRGHMAGYIVAAIIAAALGVLYWHLAVRLEKANVATQVVGKQERPHVATSLVIDSVNGQSVDFHIQVENIGKVSIHNIRVSYGTKGFRAVEIEPIPRTLPPYGRLSITGKPRVLERGEYRSVVVNIRYDTVTKKDLIASNLFRVTPARLKPQTIIDPESLLEPEASVSDEQQLEEADIPSGFSTPVGTMELVLDEYHTGTPNRFYMGDKEGTKYFEFDPVGRTVLFSVTTLSGRRVRLEQPLKPVTTGRHHVLIMWDQSKGASLDVDGVEISDFKGQP